MKILFQNQKVDVQIINDLREFNIIKDNCIDFVGYIETKGEEYFSFPFIFKEYEKYLEINPNNINDLANSIIESIRISEKKYSNYIDIKRPIDKEKLKHFIFQHYLIYNIPQTNTFKNNNSGNLNLKKIFRANNYILNNNKIQVNKIYFKKSFQTYNELSVLVATFLYHICEYKQIPEHLVLSLEWLNSKDCKNNIYVMLNKFNKDYEQLYLKSILAYLSSMNQSCKYYFTKTYSLVWEIMIQSKLQKLGNYEFQKKFVLGYINNKENKYIYLDHFNLKEGIIVDSKFKNKQTLNKQIDYKQLIYQQYLEKKFERYFSNYILYPTLLNEESWRFDSEILSNYIIFQPVQFMNILVDFIKE